MTPLTHFPGLVLGGRRGKRAMTGMENVILGEPLHRLYKYTDTSGFYTEVPRGPARRRLRLVKLPQEIFIS